MRRSYFNIGTNRTVPILKIAFWLRWFILQSISTLTPNLRDKAHKVSPCFTVYVCVKASVCWFVRAFSTNSSQLCGIRSRYASTGGVIGYFKEGFKNL